MTAVRVYRSGLISGVQFASVGFTQSGTLTISAGGTRVRMFRSGLTSDATATKVRNYRFGITSEAGAAGATKIRLYRSGLASYGVNQGPIVTVGQPQTVEAGGDYTLLGTDNDIDGVVVSRSWSLSGTTLGTTAVLNLKAPIFMSDTVINPVYSVTDDDGVTSTAQTVVTVQRSTQWKKNPDNSFTPYAIRRKT